MTTPLRQCKGCHRHVRDAHCPFCGAIVPLEGRGVVTVAALAAAVAVGVAGAACGSGAPPQAPIGSSTGSSSDSAAPQPAIPPTTTEATTVAPRGGAVYGGPPPQP
jgi:hypothetical protein